MTYFTLHLTTHTSAKYSAICWVYSRYALRRALDILASSRDREVCRLLLNSLCPGSAAPCSTELRLPRLLSAPAAAATASDVDVDCKGLRVSLLVLGVELLPGVAASGTGDVASSSVAPCMQETGPVDSLKVLGSKKCLQDGAARSRAIIKP
jgi:hypothetical protein